MSKITNAEEFAKSCREQKDNMLASYMGGEDASVSELIGKICPDDAAKDVAKEMLGQVLTDTFYSILMALSGESNLGSADQQLFKVISSDGFGINTNGELADSAYMAFYGDEA